MSINDFISNERNRILEELFSLIRIPSVSAHQHRQPEIAQCALRWKELLLHAGADTAEVMATRGNPVVFAQKIIDPSKPTVLVYGHYDVMPAEPLELWTSPAFEPEIRDEKIPIDVIASHTAPSFFPFKDDRYIESYLNIDDKLVHPCLCGCPNDYINFTKSGF